MKKKHPIDPFLDREKDKYLHPVPSREYILMVLMQLGTPVKRSTLIKHLAIDEALEEAFRRRLKAMVRDGQLLKTPQGYAFPQGIYQGTLIIDKEGEGHLQGEFEQIILLKGATLSGYYQGDQIEVQINQIDSKNQCWGRISKLIKAVTPLVVGRLVHNKQGWMVLPFDRKLTPPLKVVENEHVPHGSIVQAKILRKYSEPVVEIIEVLGDFATPGIEVKMALRKFGIVEEWPDAVLREAAQWSHEVKSDDRLDLTALDLVTIDGEDAKDFDDAVFCAPYKKGWQLWVAIADVSHYVKEGSFLDKEAYRRGNSTYLPGTVVPMLPENLSNGLCSLKPKELRLAVVCQMDINSKGEITQFRFQRALICSKARLTYTQVADMLEGHEHVRAKYAALLPSLEALHQVYQLLYQQRKKRGAINFDTIESRILFNKRGKIKSIVPLTRNVAHKMIEESMLAANVCAAQFLQQHKQPTLFRVHEPPTSDKLRALKEFLAELGLSLGWRKPSAKGFTQLIERIAERADRHIIETVMLRSLSQAQYSPNNVGHFGLAYPRYVHFTSPIRRYPDLLVHRGIICILEKKHKSVTLDYTKAGLHCSETERRSDDASRDALLALKCFYMQDKIGQSFSGIVSGVTSFGIFVELKDIYIEGLVHITGLGNEYFHYDAPHHRLIGDQTRTVYRLGDKVEIKVARVDIDTKRIDLDLLFQVRTRGRRR